MSYTVDWFIPNGSEPLKKQAERAFSGRWLPTSPTTIALLQSVAREIQLLDSTLELHPSAREGDDGYWIGSDDPDCLVPYVEFGHGTAMVRGGLGFDEDFNAALLHVYSILGPADPSNNGGVYGTQGTAAPNNVPGGHVCPVGWVDSNGSFWMFGGYGADSQGSHFDLNDLWKF